MVAARVQGDKWHAVMQRHLLVVKGHHVLRLSQNRTSQKTQKRRRIASVREQHDVFTMQAVSSHQQTLAWIEDVSLLLSRRVNKSARNSVGLEKLPFGAVLS
jgi:hypothetical protein